MYAPIAQLGLELIYIDDTLKLLVLYSKLQVSVVPDFQAWTQSLPQRTQSNEMSLKAKGKLTREFANCFTGNKTNPPILTFTKAYSDTVTHGFAKQNNLHC